MPTPSRREELLYLASSFYEYPWIDGAHRFHRGFRLLLDGYPGTLPLWLMQRSMPQPDPPAWVEIPFCGFVWLGALGYPPAYMQFRAYRYCHVASPRPWASALELRRLVNDTLGLWEGLLTPETLPVWAQAFLRASQSPNREAAEAELVLLRLAALARETG